MAARGDEGRAPGTVVDCTLVVGALGHIRFGGGHTDEVLGISLRDLPGSHLQDLLSRPDRGRIFDLMREALESGTVSSGQQLLVGDPPAPTVVHVEASGDVASEPESWILRFARRPERWRPPFPLDGEQGRGAPDLSASAIERALRQEQFELDLQPIIDLATGRPEESEALVRWLTPAGSRLTAATFINAVERAGLMSRLTRYVLEQSLRELARGPGPMGEWRINVNMTATDLVQPGFVALVRSLVTDARVDPSRLVLEFGSDLVAVDPERIERTFAELRDASGVRLALDDFSTRRTPLAVLGLPLDAIKLDRSAPVLATRSSVDASVLVRLTELCRSLDIAVVGKGIEDEGQLELLRRAGCTHGQGYLLGRPSPTAPVAVAGPLGVVQRAVDGWKDGPADGTTLTPTDVAGTSIDLAGTRPAPLPARSSLPGWSPADGSLDLALFRAGERDGVLVDRDA